MSTVHTKDIGTPHLEAAIVEPILNICINESSFFEILWKLQMMLPINYSTIKNYLFYLIEYELISYNGHRKIFTIDDGGFDLLKTINIEIQQGKKEIKDIIMIFEYIQD